MRQYESILNKAEARYVNQFSVILKHVFYAEGSPDDIKLIYATPNISGSDTVQNRNIDHLRILDLPANATKPEIKQA